MVLTRPAVRIFDRCVIAVSLILFLYTIFRLDTPFAPVPVHAYLVAAMVPLLSRYQVGAAYRSDDVEVSFDAAVLVYLMLIIHPLSAALLWTGAACVGLLSAPHTWPVRLFNVATAWLTAMSFAVVYQVLGSGMAHGTLPELVIILLAVGTGLTLDVTLSLVHVKLLVRKPWRQVVSRADLIGVAALLFGTTVLGFLAAVIQRSQSPWALILLGGPVVAMVIASRSARRSREDKRRLQVLLDSSRDRRGLDGPHEILDSAIEHARRLLVTEQVELRSTPPRSGELGARLQQDDDAGDPLWLVGEATSGRANERETDRRSLESLAAETSESLARSRLFGELSRMAQTDSLTGLASRAVFTAQAAYVVAESRTATNHPAVLYLDLDGFKVVNDRFGHHVGDGLVRVIGQRLREQAEAGQLVARLGGDEFALLIEDADRDQVLAQAERIRAAIADVCVVEGRALSVNASIGIAFGDQETTADQLLRNADMAMYLAKSNPADGPQEYHAALRYRMVERAELKDDLANAIDEGQLRVLYQPVVDLRTGLIDGVEGLVRWQHPQRGLLGATSFIEIAEESGLVRPLGEWVLRQMLKDAPQLQAAAGRQITMAVNVSPLQLADDRLLHAVREAVVQPDAPSLVLELTESAVIDDDPLLRQRLDEFVATGVGLAMDDFGVGYSSVGYLRWLPLRILKLDRSLLQSADTRHGRDLLSGIMKLGTQMDLVMLAEGVERPDQVDLLRSLGCNLAQGFLLAKPMEAGDLADLFARETVPLPRVASGLA